METKSTETKRWPRNCWQIDGGWIYTFTATNVLGGSYPVAQCVATPAGSGATITLGSNASYAAAAGTECWYVDVANLAHLASASYSMVVTSVMAGSSVAVSSSYSGSGSGSTPYFNAAEVSAWSSTAPVVPSGTTASYYGWTNPTGGASLWMRWDRTGSSGVYALTQVVWYVLSSSEPSGPISPVETYTYESSAPPTPYWTGIS